MNKNKRKVLLMISLIISGVLLLLSLYATYSNNSTIVAKKYIANNDFEIPFKKELFKSISSSGPWIIYSYKLNTKSDFNLSSSDFINNYSLNDLKFKKKVDKIGFEKIMYIQNNICKNKNLSNLIKNKNIGVRVFLSVDNKKIYQVDTVPFTCKLYDNMYDRLDKIKGGMKNEK